MTTLSGHASASYVAQGELVGPGARRRTTYQQRTMTGEQDCAVQIDATSTMTDFPISYAGGEPPQSGYKKRERRHIYHDILPLKVGARKTSEPDPGESSNACGYNSGQRNLSVKPAIPPKPKYILRAKRIRHVYQTIELPLEERSLVVPPPLPDKPTHLKQLKDDHNAPPPLPPRVVNKEAIRQRQILDQEYFENLRKSVDGDLLDLAEEADLPIMVPQNRPVSMSRSQRNDYGAHSPPLNVSATPPNLRAAQQPETPTRRHSLPIYESIADGDTPASSVSTPPALPVRSYSHDIEAKDDAILMHTLPAQNNWEVNLAQNLLLLKKCGWYWGNMTWQEAEILLTQKEQEGAFLMRDSQNPVHLLTITVRSTTNTVHHVRVEYSEGKFQLYEPGGTVSRGAALCVRHSNIKRFINLAIKHSTSGSFLYFLKPKSMGDPPVQLRFLTPISRLSTVKSLQYLCRMVIRKCVVADQIPSLHVPPRIRQYLMSGPFYDPDESL